MTDDATYIDASLPDWSDVFLAASLWKFPNINFTLVTIIYQLLSFKDVGVCYINCISYSRNVPSVIKLKTRDCEQNDSDLALKK